MSVTKRMKSLCMIAAALCSAAMTAAAGTPETSSAAPEPDAAPVIILKLDDLTPRGAAPGKPVSDNFQRTVDMLRSLGVHASLGIICNSLETAPAEFCEWIKDVNRQGDIEFWLHGYSHHEFPRENGRRVTEFSNRPYEEQYKSIEISQQLAKEKLGFEFRTFGSPFNQTDKSTIKVLDARPEITSWLFGPASATTDSRRSLERRIDLEVPIMKPNYEKFVENYDLFGKNLQYIVLQGHPNSWGGKQRAEFGKIVKFLKEKGCRFMTPSEFLNVPLREKTLPEKPAAVKSKKPAEPPLPEPQVVPQFLSNPTLLDENGDGLPDGWYRSTGSQGDVTKLGEPACPRFLRLEVTQPGDSVIFQQFAKIPDPGAPVVIAAKVRWSNIERGAKGYMTGAVQAMFADEKDKKIGDFLSAAVFLKSSDGWTVISKKFTPPEGAVKLRVQIALYSVKKGVLDTAWVTAAQGGIPAMPAAEELARENSPTTSPHKTLLNSVYMFEGDGPEYSGIKGVSLLGVDPFSFIKPFRNTDKFSITRFKPEGTEFDDAVRIEVKEPVPAVWDMQLRGNPQIPLRKGDVLLLTYWMRGVKIDSEFAETSCLNAMQLDTAPWSKVFEFRPRASVGDGWIKFQKVIVSPLTLDAGKYAFSFQFGMDPQIFEIGGLSLYNYGNKVPPEQLPRTETALYRGHEEDAPWRKEAQKRIDQIRKADLTVKVEDAGGSPVPGADVKVEMTRHEFGWGSAVYVWTFSGNDENSRKYREKFLELFNLLVPENGLKWPSWEQEKNREYTLKMIKWAKENGCGVRGHTLVWPSFKRSPNSIASLRSDPEALRKAINDHITDILSQTRGLVREWDVMNEPTTNWEFMKILGEQEPAEWFKLAKKLAPEARLFLNENQIIAGTKLRSLEINLDKIIKYGGPLEGIGIQGHLGVGTAAPEKMLEIFDRLSKYNVPLAITELDVISDNREHQAMYLRDVLTAAFSHPSVESVTFWGFWDGRHWLNNCPLYNKDWTEKPGLKVYRQLVLNDWWTREKLKSDGSGAVKTRVFKGKYRITVTTPDGRNRTIETSVSDGGTELTVQMP